MSPNASAAVCPAVKAGCFNTWAGGLEDADAFVARASGLDLAPMVANPHDPELMRKARLDSDWYAENVRCFARMAHARVRWGAPFTLGAMGLLDLAQAPRAPEEERWLIFIGQQPQALGGAAARALRVLRSVGVRIAFYAFDEASRFMPCFREVAPHLDVLIHDESPLEPAGAAALREDCLVIHRSWVANVVPFAAPFDEEPERKILFLGSQLGLTDHRNRQIAFLRDRFKDRFVAIHDHSVAVRDRYSLNRFKVGLCPEGRKFGTPAMSQTHTDRPFWSGCLGLVPVSENSRAGNRLDALAEAELILRYPYGDLEALAECCERALEMSTAERRRIYDHFNRHETVGTVVADAIARRGAAAAPTGA